MADSSLNRFFDEAGTRGTIVVKRLRDGDVVIHDPVRAGTGFLPASTFKVPNSMIALETGVVSDVDTEVFRWDGIPRREFPGWDADMSLREAMRLSCVPVYQQVARRVGRERYRQLLPALGYGNADTSGAPVDLFWLEGNLRISALEQIAFLERFLLADLPFSERTVKQVRSIVPAEPVAGGVMYAKTGWAHRTVPEQGWYVGWVERDNEHTLFATNIDVASKGHLSQRAGITRSVLRFMGAV